MAKGYVYAARAPGNKTVKIGRTSKAPENRRGQLNNTSVLKDFEFEFVLPVRKPAEVEKIAHTILANHRVRDDREFFKCSPRKARSAIKKAAVEARRWKWIPGGVRRVMNIVRRVFQISVSASLAVVVLAVVDMVFFQIHIDPVAPGEEISALSSLLQRVAR